MTTFDIAQLIDKTLTHKRLPWTAKAYVPTPKLEGTSASTELAPALYLDIYIGSRFLTTQPLYSSKDSESIQTSVQLGEWALAMTEGITNV